MFAAALGPGNSFLAVRDEFDGPPAYWATGVVQFSTRVRHWLHAERPQPGRRAPGKPNVTTWPTDGTGPSSGRRRIEIVDCRLGAEKRSGSERSG